VGAAGASDPGAYRRSRRITVGIIRATALHDDLFPEPELQWWIGGDRVDFYWPKYDVVLEADGRAKYRDDDERWREKLREQRLRNHVRVFERVVWSDVMSTWRLTRTRLWRAFR
jgi:very-short-patch-repair endonuclease